MPIKDDISFYLEDKWKDNYGKKSAIQQSGYIYLYWNDESDFNNHVHLFFEEGKWKYNIKCNGNSGDSRTTFEILEHIALDDLMNEIVENWKKECPEYAKEGGTKSRKSRKLRKSRKSRKLRKLRKSRKSRKSRKL